MKLPYLIPAMALLLGACATDGAAPTVPAIPAPPQMDPQSCYNLNLNVYQIETAKKASGHYGEGEEERLANLRLVAAAMGCFLDPNFVPLPPPPPG